MTTTMKLIWKYGHEAICPKCGHQNACLWSGGSAVEKGGTEYTCRDCKTVFVATGETRVVGKDPTMGRNIAERDCRVKSTS